MNLMDSKPIIGENVFLAPSASVIGRVELGASSSVWYGTVVRGDNGLVSVGPRTNIQDRAVLHGLNAQSSPSTVIGSSVTIGQGAVIEAATVSDEAMIGMGAVVLRGAKIGKQALVAAGAVVSPNTEVGDGELWAGSPATMVRKLSAEEIETIIASAEDHITLAAAHAAEAGKTHDQIEAEKLRRQLLEERSDDYNSHLGLLGREKEIVEIQARIVEENRKGLHG